MRNAEAETAHPPTGAAARPGEEDGRDDRPMPRLVPKAIVIGYGGGRLALAGPVGARAPVRHRNLGDLDRRAADRQVEWSEVIG